MYNILTYFLEKEFFNFRINNISLEIMNMIDEFLKNKFM